MECNCNADCFTGQICLGYNCECPEGFTLWDGQCVVDIPLDNLTDEEKTTVLKVATELIR